MIGWKEYKLKDLVTRITKGTTPSTLGGRFLDNGINFIKSEAVSYDGRIDKSCFVFIDEETHQKLKRSQLEKDDILFSMAGIFLGKNALVTEDLLPANTNQALAIIRLNQQKALPKYVHYFLRQPSVIDLVNNMSGQSAQPNINMEEIGSIDVRLPSPAEQQAIASILSSLDDKIDLLHRQNKTLEQLAETLFRRWFVEEAEEGWEEKSLYDAIKLVGGGTPKTSIPEYWDGNINWLAGGDIATNHKSFIITAQKNITEEGLSSSSAKLLPKYATVISARGTVGKYCLLSQPMAFSQSNYGILPTYKNCYFFTYLLVAHSVDELQAAAYGSVFDTITTDTFKEQKVRLPSEEVILNFEHTVAIYFHKMLHNQNQIRTLTQLRDTLLPKLMSGEVRVKM
ncbi:MAG: restriction endonuclease subunit S [Sphingobacteriales bacterium]|nr:MAG: restriction endonuclease subunit S [Sphingobacteriales bacterium]